MILYCSMVFDNVYTYDIQHYFMIIKMGKFSAP